MVTLGIVVSIILFLPLLSYSQTCTTTINPGANLGSTVAAAAAGSTICLNSGSYGNNDFGGINKASTVTIRSTTGTGASLSLTLYRTQNLTFKSLTFTGLTVNDFSGGPQTANLQIVNSVFSGSQFVLNPSAMVNANILIDGNSFTGFNATGLEGRLTIIRNPATGVNHGITVSNNSFSGGGCSDGVQIAGGANGITIGPNNVFQNLLQGSCGPHVDAIQIVGGGLATDASITITGNFFKNNTIHNGIYDGGRNLVITNNVFDTPQGSAQSHQMGAIQTITMAHNTFRDCIISVGSKFGDPLPTGWVFKNNVMVNTDFIAGGDQPGCGMGCVVGFNLRDGSSSTNPNGSGNISGSPTWVGGSSPTTYSGFLLASGSLGENAGDDGQDMGVFSAAASAPPSIVITAPTSGATFSTSSDTLTTLAGTAADDVAVTSVTWSCDVCGSGSATGTTSWSVGSITLQVGSNVITVTAHDGDGQVGDDVLIVTYTPPQPVVVINSPTGAATYLTSSVTLTTLAGVASDDVGITSVTWSCDVCGSGTATGTTSWSIGSISLQLGVNVITVTGHDASANTGSDVLTVTRVVADFTSNMLSRWKLDGSTVDTGSNGQDGTLVGSPGYDSQLNCRVGTGCLMLSGSPQAMTVVQNGEYNLHASAFTIALWVKDDTSASTLATIAHRIISWYDGTSGISIGLGTTDGVSRYYYVANRVIDGSNLATGGITTGWHHVVATFDGAGVYHMYVDGVVSETIEAPMFTPFTGNSTTLYIGQRGDGNSGTYVVGTVDDVRVYNRELSAVDVAGLYLVTEAALVPTVLRLVR